MSSAPRRSAITSPHPLIGHGHAGAVVARRKGQEVSAARFLAEVEHVAAALPAARHVLNTCTDRYRFTVLLCAAIVRGQTTLLPPGTTPNVIRALREFAPDAYAVNDDPGLRFDMPQVDFPDLASLPLGEFRIAAIPGDQAVACVFTSGSTGEPQPYVKTWGGLVEDVRGEARRLGIGAQHTILGTVPPQHMYGFESTVILPLVSGAALTAERLYYPADIDAAITGCPAPRVLFTTPFHLRAWMESEPTAHFETIVSATAPLSVGLAREAEARTGAQMLEIYGCTEAGQVATRRPALSVEWQALDGIRLWNDGEQAMCAGAHVYQPTPLQDIIEVLGDGRHFLLHGRTADMVNIAGKRNSLGYLNHQLTAIHGVKDGAFYLPDEVDVDGVTRLMAFAVAPGLSAREIVAELRKAIDAAFLPRPLVLVDRLPRQLTGKLTRESLRDLAAEATLAPQSKGQHK